MQGEPAWNIPQLTNFRHKLNKYSLGWILKWRILNVSKPRYLLNVFVINLNVYRLKNVQCFHICHALYTLWEVRIKILKKTFNAILVHISGVNLEEHSAKVNTVRVKLVQLSWAGQYKKCVPYDVKFTLVYRGSTFYIPMCASSTWF